MNTASRLLGLLSMVMVCLPASRSVACDIGLPPALVIEANPSDKTPPSTPTVTARLRRGHGSNNGSCAGNGYAVLQVSATDDVSVGADIGYVVESDDRDLFGEGSPLRIDNNGRVEILYSSDDSGDDDLALTLRVFAVDKAGNVSLEPATLTVRSEGDGCQLAGTQSGPLWGLALLALLFRQARRRQLLAA